MSTVASQQQTADIGLGTSLDCDKVEKEEIDHPTLRSWSGKLDESAAPKAALNLDFLHGDFLDSDGSLDLTLPDLIFMHSTCFEPPLMRKIAQRLALELKPGAVLITVSAPLEDSLEPGKPKTFELLHQKELWLGWGTATMFIQRKAG